MQKKIIALFLLGAVTICSLAGCSIEKNKEITEESKVIVKKQQSLAEFDGVINYQIQTDLDFSILDEDDKPDLDAATTISNNVQVQNNQVRHITTESETTSDGQKEKSNSEVWFSAEIQKKYEKVDNVSNEDLWSMSDLDKFDKIAMNLPESLNKNKGLGDAIAQALSNTKIKEKKNAAKADITIPFSDLVESGITSSLFLRATPFANDLPDDASVKPDGSLKGSVLFFSDKQLSSVDLSFDNTAYAYINQVYKSFGLKINRITIQIKVEYESEKTLDIPKKVTDNTIAVGDELDSQEDIIDPDAEEILNNPEDADLSSNTDAEKNTLAKKYFDKQMITEEELMEQSGVDSDWGDGTTELPLTDGMTAYIPYKDVLTSLTEILSNYDESDILTAFNKFPEPSGDDSTNNTYPYAADFFAMDILSQTGLFSDQISEQIASSAFDVYDLIDIQDLEKCTKQNFSKIIQCFSH